MTFFMLVVVVVGMLGSLLTTPLFMRLGEQWGLVQAPMRDRDIHTRPVPRIGGLGMLVGFLIAVIVAVWMPVPRTDPNEFIRLRGLILGALLAALIGLYDDRYELPPKPQLLAQIGLGIVAAWHLIFIEVFRNPLTGELIGPLPWWIVWPLTIFWFTGTLNTINWLDGLDGLAAGVVAIASAVFAAHMIRLGQYSVALLALALLGATLGFLPYNFNPARTFMGTTGAYFLGYTLAALGIMAGAKVATFLLVLIIPILDVAWQIVARIRQGRSPFHGDRGHLHHRLYDAGFSQRQVVLTYWGICALFGTLALLLPTPVFKLLALSIVSLGALAFFWYLARRQTNEAGR